MHWGPTVFILVVDIEPLVDEDLGDEGIVIAGTLEERKRETDDIHSGLSGFSQMGRKQSLGEDQARSLSTMPGVVLEHCLAFSPTNNKNQKLK